jgi:hypothetical protein
MFSFSYQSLIYLNTKIYYDWFRSLDMNKDYILFPFYKIFLSNLTYIIIISLS